MASFYGVLVTAQLCGLMMLALVGLYTGKYSGGGGFDWYDKKTEFNFHALFMILGLVFLYGQSILVYRTLLTVPKPTVKLIHTVLNGASLVLVVVALVAVFDSQHTPALYSFHSWLGLIVVILYFFQFVVGFITFLKPGLSGASRKWYLPIHQFFGVAVFQLAAVAVLTGLTERLMFVKIMYGGENLTINFLGISTILFVWAVSYLLTTEKFRRPTPSDSVPLASSYESIGKRLSIP